MNYLYLGIVHKIADLVEVRNQTCSISLLQRTNSLIRTSTILQLTPTTRKVTNMAEINYEKWRNILSG